MFGPPQNDQTQSCLLSSPQAAHNIWTTYCGLYQDANADARDLVMQRLDAMQDNPNIANTLYKMKQERAAVAAPVAPDQNMSEEEMTDESWKAYGEAEELDEGQLGKLAAAGATALSASLLAGFSMPLVLLAATVVYMLA